MASTVIQCVTLVILPRVADCIRRTTHFEFYPLPTSPRNFKTLLNRYHYSEFYCYQSFRDLHRARHISTNYYDSMCYQSFDFGICSAADYNSLVVPSAVLRGRL